MNSIQLQSADKGIYRSFRRDTWRRNAVNIVGLSSLCPLQRAMRTEAWHLYENERAFSFVEPLFLFATRSIPETL